MITGHVALMIVVAPIVMGLFFILKFNDWWGWLMAGILFYVSWSLATTGTLPDHSDSPITMIVVFGGILALFAMDTVRLTKHARQQSREENFVVAERAAGCAGTATMIVIVVLGILVLAASGLGEL